MWACVLGSRVTADHLAATIQRVGRSRDGCSAPRRRQHGRAAPLLAEVIEKYSAGSWLAIPTSGVRGGDIASPTPLELQAAVIVATEQATGTIFHLQYLNAGAW